MRTGEETIAGEKVSFVKQKTDAVVPDLEQRKQKVCWKPASLFVLENLRSPGELKSQGFLKVGVR